MKAKSFILPGISLLSVAAIGLSVFSLLHKPRTAYVDLGKIYNEFTLKKELETKLQQVQLSRQSQLDSMKLDLNVLAKNIQSGKAENQKAIEQEFQSKRQQYALKNQAFSEENDRVSQAYDDQIWKQLNQYVKEFGKEKEYKLIFGAEGSGTLMYADAGDDITDQVLAYVNDRYKGKNSK
jgi:outer membrane protein